ncbi:helix-turn-helix domain-containing protein [Nonomuraea sp. C10]|uniref:helix-turn-helix domain-containing protein n=1 Tax=Nonomuraea sp. C10 TaxID=2600577 RepID=UPI0011CE5EE8|nr:helix-turn-helix transcriptional regulator [Nonomuraea sp. C10]TXK41479.1 helix-turn-helix domain-containing protein [Nonomuraea sp. C10]
MSSAIDPSAAGESEVGDQVRQLRVLRGMTQEELAEASGISISVIRKIEQGGTARMETYHALARALNVVTMTFVRSGVPEPVLDSTSDLVLAPLRAAIAPAIDLSGHRLFGSADSEDLSLPRLENAIGNLGAQYHSNRYDEVAEFLPPLILSARYHADNVPDTDRESAVRLRSDALNLAARYLIQVRAHDLALTAVQEAQRDALSIGDMSLAAAAVTVQAWAMMRQGRFSEVMRLCAAAADAVEPRMSTADIAELDAWGWLLARASAASARDNQPDRAEEFVSLAILAGTRMGHEHSRPSGGSSFGPLTAALMRPENAMIAGDHGRAVELYQQLPRDVGRTDSSTWNRALLDCARAHLRIGDVARATEIMTRLRLRAPAWLRYQQLGKDTARELVTGGTKRKLTADQRALVEFFSLTG